MGLFDSLGDISMGYLARQREVQDKEADEAYQQNKSSIGNLSKFWTAAMEGSRNDPEVQQALLSRIAEVSQLDPRKAKPKDLARLADASLLWQGVKRSPESMQPKMDTMQAEVNAPSGPIIPLPQPTGLDFSENMKRESTTPLPGQRSGMQQAAPLPLNLESNIPLPSPPTEYMSVYPSQDELDFKKYGAEQAANEQTLANYRRRKQIDQEFDKTEAGVEPKVQLRNPEYDIIDAQGNIINPGTPKPSTATDPNLQNDVVLYQGKPTNIRVNPKTGREYLPTAEGLVDITGQTAFYRPPPQVQQVGGLSTGANTAVQNLANRFDTNPVVRQYNEAMLRAENVKNILASNWTGPGDMAMIFEFMRALDPTSVVRESEYATAANTGNIFSGWAAKFNGKLNPSGGFLSPQIREDFNKTLQAKIQSATRQFQNMYKDFGRRIDKITGEPGTGTEYLTDYSTSFVGPNIPPPDPNMTGGGGSIGSGQRGGNVTKIKIDAQGNIIK